MQKGRRGKGEENNRMTVTRLCVYVRVNAHRMFGAAEKVVFPRSAFAIWTTGAAAATAEFSYTRYSCVKAFCDQRSLGHPLIFILFI